MCQTPVEMWWHTVTHGRGSEGETGEWSGYPVPFTLPRNMVYPALLPLMHTSRLPVVDWTDAPRRFKWTRPFRRKTKCGFCVCAITFQLVSNTRNNARCQESYDHDMDIRRQNKYALSLPGMEFNHHVICHLSFRVIKTQWTASMKCDVSLSRCWRNSCL
jgi:hypothetical protein